MGPTTHVDLLSFLQAAPPEDRDALAALMHTVRFGVGLGLDCSALEMCVGIKAAQNRLEALYRFIVPQANKEFAALIQAQPANANGRWNVLGIAELGSFSPRGYWTYSKSIKELEETLKTMKANAQADNTAAYTPGIPTETTPIFAVTLSHVIDVGTTGDKAKVSKA